MVEVVAGGEEDCGCKAEGLEKSLTWPLPFARPQSLGHSPLQLQSRNLYYPRTALNSRQYECAISRNVANTYSRSKPSKMIKRNRRTQLKPSKRIPNHLLGELDLSHMWAPQLRQTSAEQALLQPSKMPKVLSKDSRETHFKMLRKRS